MKKRNSNVNGDQQTTEKNQKRPHLFGKTTEKDSNLLSSPRDEIPNSID